MYGTVISSSVCLLLLYGIMVLGNVGINVGFIIFWSAAKRKSVE